MKPEDHRILREFASRVRELEPCARIWAFGSRARGDEEPDSDLDLCVVVPRLTADLRRRIQDRAWEIGFAQERVLAMVILPEEEFENGPISASTLVRNILLQGVAA